MNHNVPRWTFASFVKHFKSKQTDIPFWFEGEQPLIGDSDRFEFRLDGPDFHSPSKKLEIYDVYINLLVNSKRDNKDAHKIHRDVGIGVSMFTDIVTVYRYGNTTGDDSSVFGCFELLTDDNQKLRITNFGQVRPNDNVLLTTIEGHYQLWRQI